MTTYLSLSISNASRDAVTEAFDNAVQSIRAAGGKVTGSVGGGSDDGGWSRAADDVRDQEPESASELPPEALAADAEGGPTPGVDFEVGEVTSGGVDPDNVSEDDGSVARNGPQTFSTAGAVYDANDPDNPLNHA